MKLDLECIQNVLMILNTKTLYFENQTQAGFRPGMSTSITFSYYMV